MKLIKLSILFTILLGFLVIPTFVNSTGTTVVVCNTTVDCPTNVDCGEGKSLQCIDKGLTYRYCACATPDDPYICKQETTKAKNPVTNECKDFENTCDVRTPWLIVDTCEEPVPCPPEVYMNIPKGCTLLPPCQVNCPPTPPKITALGVVIVVVIIICVIAVLLFYHK